MGEQAVAALDPIYTIKPEHVWLRVTNMEKPNKFQVILEVNGGDRNGGRDKVLYESINECDGNIGHHINLTWLVRP